jgi:hypothetical protein
LYESLNGYHELRDDSCASDVGGYHCSAALGAPYDFGAKLTAVADRRYIVSGERFDFSPETFIGALPCPAGAHEPAAD